MSLKISRSSRGFTIVETLLFLAISALLIFIVTVGQGVTQRRTQFRDAIDGLEAKLVRLQSERFSSVGRTDAGGGTTANEINFLTILSFVEGNSAVAIYSCRADRTTGPASSYASYNIPATSSLCAATETFNLKWGTHPEANFAIIFFRTHDTGALRSAAGTTTPGTLLSSSYSAAAVTPNAVNFDSANDTFSATITINERDETGEARLNQISKKYND